MDERVKEAVLFMEGNCQRKLRLRQIAAVVGLSPSRFKRTFPDGSGGQPNATRENIKNAAGQGVVAVLYIKRQRDSGPCRVQ